MEQCPSPDAEGFSVLHILWKLKVH